MAKDDSTGNIQLPPRPAEKAATGEVSVDRREDPVQGLFDVLQSAKERKTAPRHVPSQASDSGKARNASRIPGHVWLGLAVALVLGGTVFVFAKLMQHTGGMAGNVASTEKPAAPARVETIKAATPTTASAPAAAPAAKAALPVTFKPQAPAPTSVQTRPAVPRFSFAQAKQDQEAREKAERERTEREREERERDEKERDYWRAKDDRGEPLQADRHEPAARPTEAVSGGWQPAPPPGPPPAQGQAPGQVPGGSSQNAGPNGGPNAGPNTGVDQP